MRLSKVNALKVGATLCVLFFIVILAIFPDKYLSVTKDGITLWAITVLPSLLPYFFLTALLTKTGVVSKVSKIFSPVTKKLFNLSGISAYAFTMSILSGYPVGSKIVSDLYLKGLISEGEAKRMSVLCSTSGPLFIIGAVGVGMFNDKASGFIIYACHVLSSVITALLFRKFGGNELVKPNNFTVKSESDILYDAVYSSVISSLMVGGFVSIFYVLTQILIDFKIVMPFAYLFYPLFTKFKESGLEVSMGFVAGLIEFTKGCNLIAKLGVNPLTVSLCCFLITFSGASVLAQSLSFLGKAKVNAIFFILSKLVSGIIASLLCYFACLIFL